MAVASDEAQRERGPIDAGRDQIRRAAARRFRASFAAVGEEIGEPTAVDIEARSVEPSREGWAVDEGNHEIDG